MTLKAFESEELRCLVREQAFIMRNALTSSRDSFDYSLRKPEHLSDTVKQARLRELNNAIAALDKLTKYLHQI